MGNRLDSWKQRRKSGSGPGNVTRWRRKKEVKEVIRTIKKYKCEKTEDIWFENFTINNAGIRVENGDGIAVQIAGRQALLAMKEIKERGGVWVEVKYLEETVNGKLRQPTCKEVKV
jgi:hypothetical protein